MRLSAVAFFSILTSAKKVASEAFKQNSKKIIGGIAITVVGGFAAIGVSTEKNGIIYHDQGPTIKVETVDTYDEALARTTGWAKYTADKFHNGSSYHYYVVGEWVFKYQEDNAISYHASGVNKGTIGIMIVNTNDQEFDKRSCYTARQLVMELDAKYHFDFALYHSDVAKNGKEDPHEMREYLNKMGMRWDSRSYPWRAAYATPFPEYQKWVKI
jgi:hypothetical protein